MAETDKESKTEQATAKRKNEEFKQGNFPQSQEVGMTITLLAGLLVFGMVGSSLTQSVFNVSEWILGHLGTVSINRNNIEYWSVQAMMTMSGMAGPFLLAGAIGAVIAGGMQSKFRMTPKALKINWAKVNPVPGFKRIFSKDTLVKFGIDLLKLIAVCLIMWGAIKKIINDPIFYSQIEFEHIGRFIGETLIYVFIRLIIALAVIAIISYIYARWKSATDMKMTKEEVKQEKKDMDMSPELRKARMAMALRLSQKQMMEEVPNADVVVTNPTHYAVALKYERGVDEAPMVLAKGENAFARKIKEIARENGVPMVENKMVARMLYKVGQVGQAIPMEMYQSVAEILAFVYRTHKYYFHKLKSRRAAAKKKQ